MTRTIEQVTRVCKCGKEASTKLSDRHYCNNCAYALFVEYGRDVAGEPSNKEWLEENE